MNADPQCTPKHFAMIGEKSHRHSVNNPYSQFRDPATLDDVLKSPMVYEPLTKLQCSPTSDGAACCIVASEDFVRKHGLEGQAVEIAGQSMRTDEPELLDTKQIKENPRTMIEVIGYGMCKKAAQDAYKQAVRAPFALHGAKTDLCVRARFARALRPTKCRWSSCTTALAPTSSFPTRASGLPRRARVGRWSNRATTRLAASLS